MSWISLTAILDISSFVGFLLIFIQFTEPFKRLNYIFALIFHSHLPSFITWPLVYQNYHANILDHDLAY